MSDVTAPLTETFSGVVTWGNATGAQASLENLTTKNSSKEEKVFNLGFVKTDPLCSGVYHWYQTLQGDSTMIDRLQVWRSNRFSRTITHRFVVLHMVDGTVHRLDRSALTADITMLSGISVKAGGVGRVETKDEMIVNVQNFRGIEKTSQLEIEIRLEGKVELMVVLSTCYAISQNPKGYEYDLREYNCFFFSWTILIVATRHRLDITTPTENVLMERFINKDRHLPAIAKSTVALGVDVFRDLVLKAVETFRGQQQEDGPRGEQIRNGMSYFARSIWALPEWVLEGFGKRVLDAKLPLGLRDTLDIQIRVVLKAKAPEVYQRVISRIDIPVKSHDRLWIDDGVREIIRAEVRTVLMDLLWPAIIDAITKGFGTNVNSASEIAQDVLKGKSQRFVGRRTVQLWAVQNAALHGGLRAVQKATEEKAKKVKEDVREDHPDDTTAQLKSLNARMFNLAWDSAQEGALNFAQDAVKATRDSLKPKHHEARDVMWKTVWGVWDECWSTARDGARTKALEGINAIVDVVLSASVKVVLEELGSKTSQPAVSVHLPREILDFALHSSLSSSEERRMTILKLQERMQELMKRAKFGRPDELQSTMEGIWKNLSKGDFKDFGSIVKAIHREVPKPTHQAMYDV
ncbi:hypothetical protein PM082_017556 [Marasmius tenuissimus]|nr:hypothetical protein PM082_017556 [Marasmius tenuissimus]